MDATPSIDGLNRLLADSTLFYQKLRHYHWNVDGRHFFELHAKFEELYDAWALTIDVIAERILMLGGVPIHTLSGMLSATGLTEDESLPDAFEMVRRVEADLIAIHDSSARVIAAAEEGQDRGTVNLLDAIRDTMEKDLWMLRSWRKEKEAAFA
jgi:starvation-inducible DNA-binding protein